MGPETFVACGSRGRPQNGPGSWHVGLRPEMTGITETRKSLVTQQDNLPSALVVYRSMKQVAVARAASVYSRFLWLTVFNLVCRGTEP